MHIALHKIEVLVDRLIPPILAALLIVVVGEIFFTHQFELYKRYADWFDGFVVLVFAVDLWFKYSRIRKLHQFVKKYWMEIFATIPFFLIFRVLEFFKISDLIQTGQAFAHEQSVAQKIEQEAVAIAKEVSKTREITRTARMLDIFRIIGRVPRFLKATPFFEKPTGRHYLHEKRSRKAQFSLSQKIFKQARTPP